MVESGMNVRPELRTQFVKEMSAEYKRIEYKYQESDRTEKIGVHYMKQLYLLIAVCYIIGCVFMLLELIIYKSTERIN